MKKITYLHSIASVLLGLSVSVAASYPAIQKITSERVQEKVEIIKLDKSLRKALIEKDIASIRALLADDFEIYTITKGVLNKEEWIRQIENGDITITSFSNNRNTEFTGHRISNIVDVSGIFWGTDKDNDPVELSVRSIEFNEKYKIKCIVVKAVS